MIKKSLKKIPWLVKMVRSARHFLKFELRDIRDTYFTVRPQIRNTPYGFKLVGSKSIHHVGMQNGTFEPEEVAIFSEYFRKSDVFIDVGSNIGFYACMARSSGLHVVAIEPMPKNLEYIFANLYANEWTDVEVFPVGVSRDPGLAKIYGASSTGASLISNWAGSTKVFQRTIALSTIDILLGNRFVDKKLFVKVDVEGAEYFVLQGAAQLLKMEPKPTWVVEVCLNEYHPKGLNPDFQNVFNIFWSNGYEVRTANHQNKLILPDDVERWLLEGRTDSGTINYIFQPPAGS